MRVCALVSDLMDRSRIGGAISDVEFVRDAAACAGADVVLVDLARFGSEVGAARKAAPDARLVCFGPHVDEAAAEAAVSAGADVVMPRSRFFRDPAAAIRMMWATLAGADAFPESGVQVVGNAASEICPKGWAGIVAISGGILATAPSATDVDALARTLADVEPAGDWAAVFRAAPEIRGPANLAYADRPAAPPTGAAAEIEMLAPADAAVMSFVARVPSADRDEAHVEASDVPLACLREDGAVVAVAGYRVWLGAVAHMSVLVDPARRCRGLATAVADAATDHACASGLVAQWRARPPASRAVARKLGFVDVGQQMSVRLA